MEVLMAHEGFELLEKSMETALTRQLENPEVSQATLDAIGESAQDGQVSGFHISKDVVYRDLVQKEERRTKERVYEQQGRFSFFRQKLQDEGIPMLALLTINAWKRFASVKGLIGLKIDEQGRVLCSTLPFEEVKARAQFSATILGIVLFAALMASIVYTFYNFEMSEDMQVLVAFGGTCLGLAVIFGISLMVNSGLKQLIAMSKRYPYAQEDWSWKKTVKAFFPDGESPEHSDFRIPVQLPKPPDDIARLLLKLRDLGKDVWIYVQPEAFRFSVDKEEIIKIFRKYEAEAMQRTVRTVWEAINTDPIITVRDKEKNSIALCGQFGPHFKVERDAVKQVMDEEII